MATPVVGLTGGTPVSGPGGIASVVATFDLTAQAANIASTLLYTIPAGAAGMYRITALAVTTQAATTSSTLPQINVQYNDQDTNVRYNTAIGTAGNTLNFVGSNNLIGSYPNSITLKLAAGSTINFTTTGYASSGATPLQYAVHIRIEYLGN